MWAPSGGTVRVEAGARGELAAIFKRELSASKCEVVLRLSSGDVPIELEVP